MTAKRKTIQHPVAAELWRDNLRNFSMKIGFHLSLSKAMLEMLCAISDNVTWDRGIYPRNIFVPDNWIASNLSLEKRGLVVRRAQADIDSRERSDDTLYEFHCYTLTPAGQLVVDLLKLAGMFIEQDAAINKRSRRA